ncbi:MAG: alpha/beta fold hydrolase [Alphaproteobacteria bacterium]|nr:alpha/beta fold hydrolase [Alphaproteobacteria bacterium]
MHDLDAALPPPGIIARIDAGARRIATPCGGGRMIWRLWGEGPPLVLLHGNFGSWMHWVRNVGPLSRRFTVLAPDTPGFGESAMPPDPSTPRAVAEVVARGLSEIVPDGDVFLAGFSYGGRLASEIALLLEDRVRALVVVAPGGLGIADARAGALAKLRPRMTPAEVAEVHRQNLALLMISDPAAVDDLAVHIQDLNTQRARLRLSAWTEEDRLSSTARALARVRVPAKGIWAGRDAFAGGSPQDRIAIVRALHPDADIRTIAGAGHWMQYEAAERFNAVLAELLG